MTFSPKLTALARYLTGEFDNREQAVAEPAWYVHLRLWQRPVPLFTEDSITLFAEQANIVNLDRPYRPRLMRLQEREVRAEVPSDRNFVRGRDGRDVVPVDRFGTETSLQVQYYMPKDPSALRSASRNPALLESLTPDQFEFLPGCLLTVSEQQLAPNLYHFSAVPPDAPCCFTYHGNTQQVSLGFETTEEEFLSYDKGIDPTTGAAKWGAILGPYRFRKLY